jgi:hypothetical protein
MKRILAACLALMGAVCVTLPAYGGSTIAYTDPNNTSYTFLDPNWNFALAFTVNAPITVTALGMFNLDGTGFINGPVQVGIFQASGSGAQVGPTVTFQGQYAPAGLGFDVFQTISPLVLQPGSYLINEFGRMPGG